MKDTAKKMLAKIEKEQAKLDLLINKRNEYTAAYQEKVTEMNEGIKEQEKVVAALRRQEEIEKYDTVKSILGKKGISVDDLLTAAENGDMYGIQEILEGKPSVSEDSDNADTSDISEATDSAEPESTPQESYSSPAPFNY